MLDSCVTGRRLEGELATVEPFVFAGCVGAVRRQFTNREAGCPRPKHWLLGPGEIRSLWKAQPRAPTLSDGSVAGSFEIVHPGIVRAHCLYVALQRNSLWRDGENSNAGACNGSPLPGEAVRRVGVGSGGRQRPILRGHNLQSVRGDTLKRR
jgi:hypothetical protein